jgi:hypothetical protein
MLTVVTVAMMAAMAAGAFLPGAQAQPAGEPEWTAALHQALPLLGHRNWIAIVDSAYPLQISPGIQTIWTGAHQLDVVKAVLTELAGAKHVKPIVYTDRELRLVPDADAPGMEAYRQDLAKVLGDRKVNDMPHEEIIRMLDDAAKTFRVLVLKTDLTLPYTSVFLRLDCGYWSGESEKKLRDLMKAAKGK